MAAAGFWPYSYSTCEGSQANAWSDLPGQNISACRDPKGFNRTHWGMAEGIGRGAPEIDLLEVRCPRLALLAGAPPLSLSPTIGVEQRNRLRLCSAG